MSRPITDVGRAWDAHHMDNPSGHECTSWRCSADIAARLAPSQPAAPIWHQHKWVSVDFDKKWTRVTIVCEGCAEARTVTPRVVPA